MLIFIIIPVVWIVFEHVKSIESCHGYSTRVNFKSRVRQGVKLGDFKVDSFGRALLFSFSFLNLSFNFFSFIFLFNLINQYLIVFELIYIIYSKLFFIELSQFQTNILIFNA